MPLGGNNLQTREGQLSLVKETSDLKKNNIRKCLELIWNARSVTKQQLAAISSFTSVTAHKFINELEEMGLVIETGVSNSQLGKKASIYEINPKYGGFIGINIYNLVITASLFDFQMNAIYTRTATFPGVYSDKAFELICAMISKCIMLGDCPILGIGVTFSGQVDFQNGIVTNCIDMTGWNKIPLRSMLELKFKIPTVVENDVNACALALKWLKSPLNCFAIIHIFRGVGISLINNNEVYRGQNSNAGELGHTTVSLAGKLCRCGNRGCIEEFVSDSSILEESRLGAIDEVIAEAGKNNRAIHEILQNKCDYIAILVDHVIKAYDPNAIYLSSSWLGSLPSFFEKLTGSIFSKSQWLSRDSLSITLLNEREDRLLAVKGPAFTAFDCFIGNGIYNKNAKAAAGLISEG